MYRQYKIVIFILILLSGCAGQSIFKPYPDQMRLVVQQLGTDQPVVIKQPDSIRGPDKLLHYLENGRIAMLQQQTDLSIQYFNQAIKAYELQDEGAIIQFSKSGRQGQALLTNDNAIPYESNAYERIFVHSYQALNYLMKNNLEAAGVEIRRINAVQENAIAATEKLREASKQSSDQSSLSSSNNQKTITDTFEKSDRQIKDIKYSFLNGFAYYLSAIIYELRGELNDAYIDYKKALTLLPGQRYLQNDVYRLAKRLGFRQTYELLSKKVDNKQLPGKDSQMLMVIYETGFVPPKQEMIIPLYVFGGHPLPITFPFYELNTATSDQLSVWMDGKLKSRSIVLAQPQLMAAKALQEKRLSMMVRLVARAVTKAQLQRNSEKEGGLLGAVLTNVYNIVSERADLRSWLTLPGQIQIIKYYFTNDDRQVVLRNKANFMETVKLDMNASKHIIHVINTSKRLVSQYVSFN